MAFGLTGFAPGAFGGTKPLAKPSPSHSFVTATQLPAAFLYSTRSQPSIMFQVAALAALLVGSAKYGSAGVAGHPAGIAGLGFAGGQSVQPGNGTAPTLTFG